MLLGRAGPDEDFKIIHRRSENDEKCTSPLVLTR